MRRVFTDLSGLSLWIAAIFDAIVFLPRALRTLSHVSKCFA